MEWQLADVILCPSEYVRTSIAAVNGPVDKCQVVPYGVDSSEFSQADSLDHEQISGQPLRVLYVGSVGVMKGIVYLLKAMSKLSDIPVQCRIVGAWRVNPHVLKSHTPENVELVGPVPRVRIAQEYKNADVFCLPSLSEGSATVVYEALAAGLPVVTTHHSGTIVRDEVEGFIVPIRDPDAIAESLCQLASDRSLLASMSEAAYARSAYGSLDTYGSRLLEALEL
jgi:glycosyltransferase involved in cell wall biosynthesis